MRLSTSNDIYITTFKESFKLTDFDSLVHMAHNRVVRGIYYLVGRVGTTRPLVLLFIHYLNNNFFEITLCK